MKKITKMFVVCVAIPEICFNQGARAVAERPDKYVIGVFDTEKDANDLARRYAEEKPGTNVSVCAATHYFCATKPTVFKYDVQE